VLKHAELRGPGRVSLCRLLSAQAPRKILDHERAAVLGRKDRVGLVDELRG